jgi:SAM-dependent methyltransferase
MSRTGINRGLTAESFVARWSGREGGQERANCSLFLTELCDLLDVKHPDPASASHEFNDYVFERRVERILPDGKRETGRIDLYKRDHFILEAKQSRLKLPEPGADLFTGQSQDSVGASGIDHLMIKARRQAEGYALGLPADHDYPPFILVCDVGRAIELYADFSGHGRHYRQFPDANGFRVSLDQLKNPDRRELLRRVWEQPRNLDPALRTAKVTREIAGQLAEVSKALEARDFKPGAVAIFLMRCLFTMFVEDVGLIRTDSFKELLDRCLANPRRFPFEMADLWRHMDIGDYSPAIGEKLLRFNGKLFKNATALPLLKDEIKLLREAAAADWRDLEPAIFGALFEQAIDAAERKKLGAHYTPRAYVEQVVDATVIEPLATDWIKAQSAAERASRAGSRSQAIREIVDFLKALSSVRVLDPACGTGNFLYVALRRMKQLEGEVLKQLHDVGGDEAVEAVGDVSVKPDQFFGLEFNRRAVEIAELVLWIGYLQWHLRTRTSPPKEPVLGSGDHVRAVDAVLSWKGAPEPLLKRDALGKPIASRGGSPIYSYPNPSSPKWPDADFIVGNPPFIGGKDIRSRLGEGYAKALWKIHPQINPSADYVMYWWDRAAELLTAKGTRLRRFGFVTTNSITQVFQRRIVEQRLNGALPVSLILAIPDHPWTKESKDAAAVRIAMTVAQAGSLEGVLREVVREKNLNTDEPRIEFSERYGILNSDLTIGSDVGRASALNANDVLCYRGVQLMGTGFLVSREVARRLGLTRKEGLGSHIREYRNGRDLTARSRDLLVIDLLGVGAQEARKRFPEVYQHLLEKVKPERDRNNRASYRNNWWLFGEPRRELRPALAGLDRYIATVETAKHRVFQFLEATILPDNMLVVIGIDDAFHLGVLSSRIHTIWALRSGGWLGVGNDPRYSKSRCFDPFPFPEASRSLKKQIRAIADDLDNLRKVVCGQHPDITLTSLYNVLEEIKGGMVLGEKSLDIKDRGRVLILKDLHEQIDVAVAAAYGWSVDLSDEDVLQRIVALNAERSAEERRGLIRWLRPDYQIEKLGPLAHNVDRVQTLTTAARNVPRRTFPVEERAQAGEVLELLSRSHKPLTSEQIAERFRNGDRITAEIEDVLKSLDRLGQAETFDNGRSYFRAVT